VFNGAFLMIAGFQSPVSEDEKINCDCRNYDIGQPLNYSENEKFY
jgi:hypothetical protein